jgi:hypothetical protein
MFNWLLKHYLLLNNQDKLLIKNLNIFQTLLYAAIVLYAPTIALSSVTSLPWWASILVLGACSTFYTALGGIKAIVWTVRNLS